MADPAAVWLEGFRILFIPLIECDFFRSFIVSVRGLTQLYFVWIKMHVSYSVLSQDFNGVICFGARCSESPKIAIDIHDVITLYTQWSHLVVKNGRTLACRPITCRFLTYIQFFEDVIKVGFWSDFFFSLKNRFLKFLGSKPKILKNRDSHLVETPITFTYTFFVCSLP